MNRARLALTVGISTALVFLFLFGIAMPQENEGPAKQKVLVDLLWEKEFKEQVATYLVDLDKSGVPLLRAVAFVHDHGSGQSATDGKRGVVKFFDSDGGLSKVVEAESNFFGGLVMISKGGECIGFTRALEGSSEFITKVGLELYDVNGNLIWADKSLDARPCRVLSDGTVLSYEGIGWEKFTLRDANGIIRWLRPAQGEAMYGATDISENDYIVFNIHKDVGLVVVYDGEGSEIWRKEFKWGHTGKVSVSDKVEYVAAVGLGVSGRILHVRSRGGKLLWQYPSGDCEFMDFSPDSRYLAAGVNLNEIHLLESDSGSLVWRHKLQGRRRWFAITVSKDGEYVAAADGAGSEDPLSEFSVVYLFDHRGEVVWERQFKIHSSRAPDLRLTDDGKYLLIASGNSVCCYEITGKK